MSITALLLGFMLYACATTELPSQGTPVNPESAIVPTAPSPALVAQRSPQAAIFRTEELEQLVAPIALYPDALLAQILMASTYPLEIVSAERWVKANPHLQDQGYLQTTPEQRVIIEHPAGSQTTIVKIEPVNPQVVYVLTYNPTVVYRAWPYPAYPPYYYCPPEYVAATSIFSFGVGMARGGRGGGRGDELRDGSMLQFKFRKRGAANERRSMS